MTNKKAFRLSLDLDHNLCQWQFDVKIFKREQLSIVKFEHCINVVKRTWVKQISKLALKSESKRHLKLTILVNSTIFYIRVFKCDKEDGFRQFFYYLSTFGVQKKVCIIK